MDPILRLLAIEDIKQLKARYFRAFDTQNWQMLRQVLADDVVCDFRGSATDPATGDNASPSATNEILKGADVAVAACRNSLNGVVTIHHGHMPEIEICSATTAKAIWAMFDKLCLPPGSAFKQLTGFGHYHETYSKLEGVWKIQTLQLVRLRVERT